jgi:hypothetical protein
MRRLVFLVGSAILFLLTADGRGAAPAAGRLVPIVVGPQAEPAVQAAARDLVACLHPLYPREQFSLAAQLPAEGCAILLGSVDSDPRLKSYAGKAAPIAAESYLVTTATEGRCRLGIIAGADTRGTVYGVYGLLAKLGCAFCLSGDTLPAPRQDAFSLDGWQLADRPLVATRLVFNWHNFLSGCSTWNPSEWQSWTRQSQRMGYNAVMVHAYGNNPMVSFSFNGRTKPVGYLSTTASGRDWSTQHVADVRRLWGGQVFTQPVFGADAALVPDAQRAQAAQKLMRDVFADARSLAMEVYFADDVDTPSANPQELIETLPPQARFSTGAKQPLWLANPDTPEGYRYYRAQVESLLAAYPQITCLVVWFRTRGTPWMEAKLSELPPAWQTEYQAELARTPNAATLWKSHNIVALGKIVRAFDRALGELGQRRVRLASGTWGFEFLAPCDRFFPPRVALIGLDYNVLHDRPQLGDAASRKVIADVGARRDVIPVIWAHHDDGNYIGRPYTPFDSFHARLADARAAGFGIIHWTTRPLDLFFTSHARQVWQGTRDQPLRTTCADLATAWFGAAAGNAMGAYLEDWVTGAPKFARETTDLFIDRPLADVEHVLAGCRERLKRIDPADRSSMTPAERQRCAYFRGLEEFIVAFYQTHSAFQNAQALARKGDLAGARKLMADCHPEPVIERFARFSALGGITRGEQGLVVSLNLRWLTHYVQLRQSLAMEPVRYRFGPTSHDKLAQAAGRFTYAFDAQHRLWQTLGTEETGAATFATPNGDEICRSGIESQQPITITLGPIMQKGSLPPGRYRLRLWFADPSSSAAGQRVFTVSVAGAVEAEAHRRVDVFQQTGQAGRTLEIAFPLTVPPRAKLQLTLTPERGKALLCACTVEPAAR